MLQRFYIIFALFSLEVDVETCDIHDKEIVRHGHKRSKQDLAKVFAYLAIALIANDALNNIASLDQVL